MDHGDTVPMAFSMPFGYLFSLFSLTFFHSIENNTRISYQLIEYIFSNIAFSDLIFIMAKYMATGKSVFNKNRMR